MGNLRIGKRSQSKGHPGQKCKILSEKYTKAKRPENIAHMV
jgi:hypothetical protein